MDEEKRFEEPKKQDSNDARRLNVKMGIVFLVVGLILVFISPILHRIGSTIGLIILDLIAIVALLVVWKWLFDYHKHNKK